MKKLLLILLGLSFATNAYAATFTIQQVINPVSTGFVYSNGSTLSTLVASSSPFFSSFSFGTTTGKEASTTNLFSTIGTFTNLFGINISGFGLTSCSGTSALTYSGTTFGCALQPQGTVTSVTGTSNRITSTGGAAPVIDISASYVGQGSITTVGTLSSGAVPASLVTSGTFGVGDYVFPGNLITTGNSTTTNATSTNAFATKTTSGTFYSGGLTTCNGANNALLWASGTFGCTTITSSGGSGNVATSSSETSGLLPFWTSTNGTPATLSGGVAGLAWNNTTSELTSTNLLFTNATGTQATTTSLSVSGNASTTSLYGSGLFACNGASNALTWNAGKFGCNTITGGGGGGGGGSQWSTSTQPATAIYNNVLGNVGIGTTTPVSRLTVSTTTLVSAATPLGLLIGNRGLVSGSSNGTIFGMNTDANFSGNAIDLQNGGFDAFDVSANGSVTAAFGFQSLNGGFTASAASGFVFAGRSIIGDGANGTMYLTGQGVDFTRLGFGSDTSASFPAFGFDKNTQSIFVENADGSAGGRFAVGTTSAPSRLTIATTTLVNAATPLGLLIGNRGLVSGDANGTVLGVNTDAGFTGKLFDFQVGGGSAMSLDSVGTLRVSQNIQATNAVLGSAALETDQNGFLWFLNRSTMASPQDGVLKLANAAAADFSLLQFGGTTNLFPSFAIATNTTPKITARLADNSFDVAFEAATTTIKGSLIVSGGTGVVRLKGYTVATLPAGTQGDTAFVTDALAPSYLGLLTGGGSTVTSVFYNGTAWVAQ